MKNKKIFIPILTLFLLSILLMPTLTLAGTSDPTGQGGQTPDTGTGGQAPAGDCTCTGTFEITNQTVCENYGCAFTAGTPPICDCVIGTQDVPQINCTPEKVLEANQITGVSYSLDCDFTPAPLGTPPAPITPPATTKLPNFLAGTAGEETDINEVIGRIVKAIIGISGSAALIVFIYGGVLWLISAGNPDRIKKGRAAMMYAAIGLIVIFLSYTLVAFILRSLRG